MARRHFLAAGRRGPAGRLARVRQPSLSLGDARLRCPVSPRGLAGNGRGVGEGARVRERSHGGARPRLGEGPRGRARGPERGAARARTKPLRTLARSGRGLTASRRGAYRWRGGIYAAPAPSAPRQRRGARVPRILRGQRPRRSPRARRGRHRGPLRGDRAPRHRAARQLRARGEVVHVRERRSGRRDHGRAPALHAGDRPLSAPDQGAGDRAEPAGRARGPRGEGADDQLEPAARRLDREALPGPRPHAPRPDPGGHHRPDPRRREVRLAQGLQVLDLRDLVDPPGRAARRRQQVARDPRARAHRRARAAHLACRARPRAAARPHAHRRGGRRRGADHRRRRWSRCARPRGR